ncbi:hypothetical protein O3M35_002186 [Rhynocoris fuscipes]|uniref:Uncharacterized protein n=1 Tax=Rhynocoris fuscipes TaxID=488301 RepID=A0AAW1CWR9_9HEMI
MSQIGIYIVKTTQTTDGESGRVVAPGHDRWLLEQGSGRRPTGRPSGWIKGRRTWSEGNQGGGHLWSSPTPKTRTRRSWPVAPHSQRRCKRSKKREEELIVYWKHSCRDTVELIL